jgi:hypothetical protein
MPVFSEANERKIVAAYIRSNIFFPQLRFAFVLALGRTADAHLLEEMNNCTVGEMVAIENIILAANRTHSRYGVGSVLPTKPKRVFEELHKSVEVFARLVSDVRQECAPSESSADFFATLVRESSRKFWDLSANSWYSESHLTFVSDPAVTDAKSPIRKTSPDQHPSLHSLHAYLQNQCRSRLESIFVKHLKYEIIHPFTVMRTAV